MPLQQRFVYCRHDLLVRQDLIGVLHPVFPQIAHFIDNQPIAEAELCPPHLIVAPPVCGAAPDAAARKLAEDAGIDKLQAGDFRPCI
jgi:hypothetical protein